MDYQIQNRTYRRPSLLRRLYLKLFVKSSGRKLNLRVEL